MGMKGSEDCVVSVREIDRENERERKRERMKEVQSHECPFLMQKT